jgi:hypothetical protein
LTNQQTRHVQTRLLREVHRELRSLAYDLNRSICDLMSEGAGLLLRHYGRGEGLPDPRSPTGNEVKNIEHKRA